jgi:hypothetical protein
MSQHGKVAVETWKQMLQHLLNMIRILNMCLVGTPGGPTVRVICLADLFPSLTAVSLVHHIYIL